jgi:hypothetical protein
MWFELRIDHPPQASQVAGKLKKLSFRSRRTFSVNRGAFFAEESLFSWL